jgi:hypothetical protein
MKSGGQLDSGNSSVVNAMEMRRGSLMTFDNRKSSLVADIH